MLARMKLTASVAFSKAVNRASLANAPPSVRV